MSHDLYDSPVSFYFTGNVIPVVLQGMSLSYRTVEKLQRILCVICISGMRNAIFIPTKSINK